MGFILLVAARAPLRWSEEELRAHALAVGSHVVLDVYELAGDVAPADIPPEDRPAPEAYLS